MNILALEQLHDLLVISAKQYPDKIAIVCQETTMSYRELMQAVDRTALQFIDRGCQPGDRIVLCLGNSLAAVIGFWAALKANCIIALINPNLPESKKSYIQQDSGATLYIDQPFALNNDSATVTLNLSTQDRQRADLASIIYTSGSTGEPKGVMLSHANMLAATNSLNAYLQYRHDDKILCVSPLSFDYGLYQMIMSCSVGATLYLVPDMTIPGLLLKMIAKEQITIVPGVPTLFSLLHQYSQFFRYSLAQVRMVTNTGAALGKNHIQMIKEIFLQARLFSMYGLTECKRCTYLPPEDIEHKPDSVGIAIPNTRIWIANEQDQPLAPYQVGQLVVEGETVMQGYWNKPEETAKKLKMGKLFTGDYGYLDEQGYFYFQGRLDEVIKYRGQKLSPREIESVLERLPGVIECAVIGEWHAEHLTLMAYLVVAKKTNFTETDVLAHCRQHLSAYQIPTKMFFIDHLPKTDNGKINKKLLQTPSTLNDLMLRTAQLYPLETAIWLNDQRYSYQSLMHDALALAGVLATSASPTCALFSSRSYVLYQAVVASLFSGKAYVPLNPRIPVARNAVMLTESLAKILIIDQAAHDQAQLLLRDVKEILTIVLPDTDEIPAWLQASKHRVYSQKDLAKYKLISPLPVQADSPAYLLFTSGSTGTPKGVAVSHRNMLSYYQAGRHVYQPTAQDRFAQLTELTFDLSMHDLFLAWGSGASIYCLPEKLYGGLNFYLGVAQFIKTHALTFWMSVPSTATIMHQSHLLKPDGFPSLRCTVFCGEALTNSLANYWQITAPNSKIFNLYGPTEATIGFTVHEWSDSDSSEIVSIGKPLPGQKVCVLDSEGDPCAPNVIGELYLSGSQVVEGYWHNSAMSSQKFIQRKNTDRCAEYWYRTGDLVMIEPNQSLRFVGRVDDQLQIRGCRVERLEIELELKKIAQTESVAILPWPIAKDGTLLGVTAFISNSLHSTENLLKTCKTYLPTYMIPAAIHHLEQLPLNSNGKVDYKNLQQQLLNSSVTAA